MIIQFLSALLLPWAIGTAFLLATMKKRQGSLLLFLGIGCLLGYFFISGLMHVYVAIGRLFNIKEFLLIELAILIILSVPVFRHLIYSNRTSKYQSAYNLSYPMWAVIFFVILAMVYQLGLAFIDLMSKPLFPWDGWSHWSAKAKIFYYYLEFPTLYDTKVPFWQFEAISANAVNGANRHPYFVSVIQTYTALAWGQWSDSIVNLPWLQCGIAMVLTVIGGLRYLGISWLLALFTGYMVLSLPILDTHMSLGSYADIWVALGFLSVCITLVIALDNKDWRFALLCLVTMLIVHHTKYTALLLLLPALVSAVCYHFLGKWKFIILLLAFALCLPVLYFYLPVIQTAIGKLFNMTWLRIFWYNENAKPLLIELFVKSNWHLLFLSFFVVLFILFFTIKYKQHQGIILLSIIASLSLLLILFVALFTNRMEGSVFVSYINRVMLHIAPLLCLIPACCFQLYDSYRKEKY